MGERKGTVAGFVRSEIDSRLAAITPEQFAAPGLARDETMHVVCVANDEVKRLNSLRHTLADECRSIIIEGKAFAEKRVREIVGEHAAGSNNIADVLRAFKELEDDGVSPETELRMAETVGTLREFEDDLAATECFGKLVQERMWRKIRGQHPDLTFKDNVCITSDWSLCWKDPEDDNMPVEIRQLLESLSSGGNTRRLGIMLGRGGDA